MREIKYFGADKLIELIVTSSLPPKGDMQTAYVTLKLTVMRRLIGTGD